MFTLCIIMSLLCNAVLTEDIRDLDLSDLVKLGQDILQVVPYEVQPSDVQFYLLTNPNLDPLLITSENKNVVDNTKLTHIVIHGWIENHKRSWYKNIGEIYLENDLNFVEVDWEKVARMPYIYAAKSVKTIGQRVAQFIEDSNLSPKNVHIIGHSLGSHVAGFAGKKILKDTGHKLRRITGLDPAGPYFRFLVNEANERISKDDAETVDVLHTDAGFYGYENPIGTLDIYVNGGQRIQPGCLDNLIMPQTFGDVLEDSFCSHARSTKFFIEWINKGKFDCKFCQFTLGLNFLQDGCLFSTKEVLIGSEDVMNFTGVCYTKTNEEEPYLNY